MNILFVCSRNKWRSATAETIYKNNREHVKSAGTEPSAVVKVSERLIEKYPGETLQKKIIVLDIEDNYNYMDAELIEIIKTSVEPYLSKPNK